MPWIVNTSELSSTRRMVFQLTGVQDPRRHHQAPESRTGLSCMHGEGFMPTGNFELDSEGSAAGFTGRPGSRVHPRVRRQPSGDRRFRARLQNSLRKKKGSFLPSTPRHKHAEKAGTSTARHKHGLGQIDAIAATAQGTWLPKPGPASAVSSNRSFQKRVTQHEQRTQGEIKRAGAAAEEARRVEAEEQQSKQREWGRGIRDRKSARVWRRRSARREEVRKKREEVRKKREEERRWGASVSGGGLLSCAWTGLVFSWQKRSSFEVVVIRRSCSNCGVAQLFLRGNLTVAWRCNALERLAEDLLNSPHLLICLLVRLDGLLEHLVGARLFEGHFGRFPSEPPAGPSDWQGRGLQVAIVEQEALLSDARRTVRCSQGGSGRDVDVTVPSPQAQLFALADSSPLRQPGCRRTYHSKPDGKAASRRGRSDRRSQGTQAL